MYVHKPKDTDKHEHLIRHLLYIALVPGIVSLPPSLAIAAEVKLRSANGDGPELLHLHRYETHIKGRTFGFYPCVVSTRLVPHSDGRSVPASPLSVELPPFFPRLVLFWIRTPIFDSFFSS
ncbi:hypothetical protein B296_00053073 [Ensete ventricosum]|uniref:Uncharacterized protein n=1 Tax=Ensete ventricosum TaxID=4639 RepID=A0A426X5V8_ENSVE|nr:hypothetical protein B296_00053073 [Ensete ventricosum]